MKMLSKLKLYCYIYILEKPVVSGKGSSCLPAFHSFVFTAQTLYRVCNGPVLWLGFLQPRVFAFWQNRVRGFFSHFFKYLSTFGAMSLLYLPHCHLRLLPQNPAG